jgi:hypothetical protein
MLKNNMSLTKNDIRYRCHCFICKQPLGDYALTLPKEQRLCWDHRKHDIKKIPYQTVSHVGGESSDSLSGKK